MFADAWDTFCSAPSTLGPTPGEREAWRRGRRRYAVWVLRVDDPEICARRTEMAAVLAEHGVPGPFSEPHVTVFVCGFPTDSPRFEDDVAHEVLARQADTIAPLVGDLAIGGLNAFRSCAFLEVHDPNGALARLRAPLADAASEIRFAPYVPHLTVGVFGDSRPTGPIARSIAHFRDLRPLPWRPNALELVTFDAAEPGSPLRTDRVVCLGGREDPPPGTASRPPSL